MKAFVFAAGLGTRLRPFTFNHPKALVEVGGKPMLRHVIDKVVEAGASEVVVNVHHFAEQITNYIWEIHDEVPAKIIISDESERLLDTGGGLLKASRFLDGNEPFIVHNADVLSDVNLREMLADHLSNNADATLFVADRHSTRKLAFSESGRLTGWVNMMTGKTISPGNRLKNEGMADMHLMCFNGVHIISPRIFKHLKKFSDEEVFSIIPFYSTNCDKLKIRGYAPEGVSWYDVGKPENLEEARHHWDSNLSE